MTASLPPEFREYVERTLAMARLRSQDRAAVRAELESHFLDGIDAGVAPAHLLERYGDPTLTGALIGRAKRRSPGRMTIAVAMAATVAAAVYVAAFALVHTAPRAIPDAALETEAELVTDRTSSAQSRLSSPDGVWAAYAVAAELRRRRSLFAEPASILLLREVADSASSLLSAVEREQLRDSLRLLAAQETLLPRRAVVQASLPSLERRVFGINGRVDRPGLRLLQRAKGATHLPWTARLAEPLYFAAPLTLLEVRQMVTTIVNQRMARAEEAGRTLSAGL